MARALSITKLAGTAAMVVLAGGAALLGYRFLRADIAAGVYRQRLQDMARQYASLRERYNDAVRKTVVTELLVKDDALSVRVRDASGVLREIPTPYDPRQEIYVDYVVLDGRLWIRRVFDAHTPPSAALVIDPVYSDVDWDCADAQHGKAVYRSLDEGRWVVTASGNGSLGLVRAGDGDDPGSAQLIAPPPTVKEFEAELTDADAEVKRIGLAEVWRELVD